MNSLRHPLLQPLGPTALDLLRSYDLIMCDPNRQFSICFHEGTVHKLLLFEGRTWL